jgi:two-component system sensor kinase FixL
MSMFTLQDSDRLALLQSLKTCIILHDAKTKNILWANAAACAALGFTVEELLPLKAPDMTRKAEKYRHEIGLQWLETAAQEGESIIEWCYRAKDGREILSEAVATRVSLHDRDAVMVQFRDIAAEERIKQDLKRLETRLKEFMHDLSEGIAVLTREGDITYLSESSRRLLGLSEDGEVPINFIAMCHQSSRRMIATQLKEACVGQASAAFRYRIRNNDGSVHWHDASCRYVELDDDLSGVLLHFRDVTAQVIAQETRRLNERKLEYLARYNAMGEMAMTISHELSQPLASARNFLEGGMLRLKDLPGPSGEILWGMENVLKQVERASAVIKSVRDYVVKLEQVEEPADLNAIVHDLEHFIWLKARDARVKLEVHLDDQPLQISCEKILIGQVILNFAFNAVEAMIDTPLPERVLSIHTRREGGRVVLQVSDRGPGVDIGKQQKVFDGFFTSKMSGNGIGRTGRRSISPCRRAPQQVKPRTECAIR